METTAKSKEPETNTPVDVWDTLVKRTPPPRKDAVLAEGGVYRGKVYGVTIETSKRDPSKKYPRIKFVAFDEHGDKKPVSWIPRRDDEIRPAVECLNPAGWSDCQLLVGEECCVKISLERGVIVTDILPKNTLTSPTLRELGLL